MGEIELSVPAYSRGVVEDFVAAAAGERAGLLAVIADAEAREREAREAVGTYQVMMSMLVTTNRELDDMREGTEREAARIVRAAGLEPGPVLSEARSLLAGPDGAVPPQPALRAWRHAGPEAGFLRLPPRPGRARRSGHGDGILSFLREQGDSSGARPLPAAPTERAPAAVAVPNHSSAPEEYLCVDDVWRLILQVDRDLGVIERRAELALAAAERAEAYACQSGAGGRQSAWALVRLQRFLDMLHSEAEHEATIILSVARDRARPALATRGAAPEKAPEPAISILFEPDQPAVQPFSVFDAPPLEVQLAGDADTGVATAVDDLFDGLELHESDFWSDPPPDPGAHATRRRRIKLAAVVEIGAVVVVLLFLLVRLGL